MILPSILFHFHLLSSVVPPITATSFSLAKTQTTPRIWALIKTSRWNHPSRIVPTKSKRTPCLVYPTVTNLASTRSWKRRKIQTCLSVPMVLPLAQPVNPNTIRFVPHNRAGAMSVLPTLMNYASRIVAMWTLTALPDLVFGARVPFRMEKLKMVVRVGRPIVVRRGNVIARSRWSWTGLARKPASLQPCPSSCQ